MLTEIIIQKPTIEYHAEENTIGIGETTPRLSWKILAAPADFSQHAYEIQIDRENGFARTKSTRRFSTFTDQQILVSWPDEDLCSRERFSVSVRVFNGSDWSNWSEPTFAEVGLVAKEEWQGIMICSPIPVDRFIHGEVSLIRKEFMLSGEVLSARLYTTAHGLFDAEINGVPVSTDILKPGWTSYNLRLRYLTNDVTSLLKGSSANVLGFWLSDGWYKGRFGFLGGRTNIFGDKAGLFAQLEVTYTDGRQEVISTDLSWKFSNGPITFSGLYDGEHYDQSLEKFNWSAPYYDDTAWVNAKSKEFDAGLLVAPDGPLVQCTDVLRPVSMTKHSPNRTLYDFGQNFSGRVQILVRGAAGDEVVLRHAEVLQNGEIYMRPLREADATDKYKIAFQGSEHSWEPKFTIHGFRYVEVETIGENCELLDLIGKVYHTDMQRTGYFSCSDPMLNKLFENVVWSMRSNFVDLPTDCPQRDERLGWTGDIQVFGSSAAFLYDVRGILSSWLKDLALEQKEYGNVPWYVPYVPGAPWPLAEAGNVWGDVATITPWELYQLYDDIGFIERQYLSAKAWIEKVLADFLDEELIVSKGVQLADWLEPEPISSAPEAQLTDPSLVATAYTLKSLKIISQMSTLLGLAEEHARYSTQYDAVLSSFRRKYFHAGGVCSNPTQTAYSLAIVFELVEEIHILTAGDELASLVRRNAGKIGTGFAGTLVVLDALTLTEHEAEAFMLIQCRECPSWLYQIDMGGTTVWERWDSMLPDGTVNPNMMTSFNHYALGAVIKWLYQSVGGVKIIKPGYKEFLISPLIGGGLTNASTQLDTPYGKVECKWDIKNDSFDMDVHVPVGTTAKVELPDNTILTLSHGHHSLSCRV